MRLIYDNYNGVTIDKSSIPNSLNDFREDIEYLLSNIVDKNLLWIKLDINQSHFIPILTDCGFVFHHCNEYDITLLKKLKKDPIVPTPKNHTIGVGAVVIDKNQLLVIKDKIYQKYKLPGGHIDNNENISTALTREVYEETGIEVSFNSIISIGHFYPAQFGESNIYVVCTATPLTYEINIQDTEEIIDAKWISIDEYLNDEDVHEYNKKIVKNSIKIDGLKLSNDKFFTKVNANREYFF
jgi:8-oxo-dGTP diphosphatase